jgi:hypothetical protein
MGYANDMAADAKAENDERIRNNMLSKAVKTIWVTFQREGIHKYPAALEDPKLAEVSFLGYPHRHMFHFKVEIQVFHDDRDIEFILFKRELEKQFDEGVLQLDFKSCEMISDDLAAYITNQYPGRSMTITVSEDGENGATAQYTWKDV